MIIETLVKLLFCHVVGDFLLQNEYIAKGKGQNWYLLFVHCVLYALPFYIGFGLCWQLGFIALLHFPIDAMKARWKMINEPTDQFLHYILCLTYLI